MKKLYIPLMLLLLINFSVSAQEYITYYHNNNVPTSSKDSATYYLKFKPAANGLMSYERHCMNNVLKETGMVQNTTTLIKEGEITLFYPNGEKKEVINYTSGLPNGVLTHYFPNGEVNYKIVINSAGYGYANQEESSTRYLYCANLDREIILKDGNGYFTAYNDDLKIAQEGKVKNTSADGLWKGFDNDRLAFIEFYENGKLVKGENYATNGVVYNYQQRNKRPEPKGGINNFYSYVSNSLQGNLNSSAKMMMKFTVDVR